jgi:uncharacterized protein YbjT (DUF2867 family)
MKRILVTGATGNIGRAVVSQLAAQGAPVRAMVRNPEAARLPANVEVVQGDLTVPQTVDACLDGVDAVFLVWTAAREAAAPAIEPMAKQARRIVFLSSPHKTQHPLFQQPNPLREFHSHIERLIEGAGVEWTMLRPGMFAANARSWWAPQIRAGDVVRWPYLSVPTTPIHERDVAAAAVRALCEDGHAGAEYLLTGPESLTQAEQIETIGRMIGRRLRVEEITPDEARREMAGIMPAFAIEMLLNAWSAAIGHPAWMTSAVNEITGSRGRTFAEWVSDHAGEFRA